MKFSILTLLGLTLCIALLVVTIQRRHEVQTREGELRSRSSQTDMLGRPLASREVLTQQTAVSLAILSEFGVPPESTRFRKNTSNSTTDPAIYFTDTRVQQLCRSIAAHRLDETRRLLLQKVDVNATGDGGITPLFWSVAQSDREAFKLLLENHADPDMRLTDRVHVHGTYAMEGDSLLMTCAVSSGVTKHFLVEAIQYSKNVNQRRANGDTLLIASIRAESFRMQNWTLAFTKTFELLIACGVDLNAQNKLGETACMAAKSQPQLCLWLIEQGADPFVRNLDGKDLLDMLEPDLEFYSKSNRRSEGAPHFRLRDRVLELKNNQ